MLDYSRNLQQINGIHRKIPHSMDDIGADEFMVKLSKSISPRVGSVCCLK